MGEAFVGQQLRGDFAPGINDVRVDEELIPNPVQQRIPECRFAALAPIEVEREIHLTFDGRIVICKIDAIYFVDGRYQVVDWKTGKAPKDAADLEEKQLQLALYRLAYARWKDIDIELVDAMFYFVADDRVIVPERIFDEDALIGLWRAAAIRTSA